MRDLQQIADQLAGGHQVGGPQPHCAWYNEQACDCGLAEREAAILSALQSAARQGQREALNQAAHDAATSGFVNADGFPVDVSGDVIALWLRARASALEGGTK